MENVKFLKTLFSHFEVSFVDNYLLIILNVVDLFLEKLVTYCDVRKS